MKHLITVLFIASISYSKAQSFALSEPINVADGYGMNHPQVEMSGDGLPIVLWTNPSNLSLYFAKHNGVDGFLSPIKLNPDNLEVQSYNWSGPDLAVDGDNIYVVFRSYGYDTGHIYLVKSTDNGANWSDTLRVDNLATGFGQYPDIAVFNDTLWVTFMDHDASGLDPQYVVARSVDAGASFQQEVAAGALMGNEACDCCQPEIIADEDQVIVFFRNNDNNVRDIKAIVSTDRGASFTDSYSVDDHNWTINSCPSTGPDAQFSGLDKTLTIYRTYENSAPHIYINEYDVANDVSLGMVEVKAASSSNNIINYPQLDYKDGVIATVWEASGQGTDVYLNISTTGISGLDENVAMNITDTSGTQSKPDVIIGENVFHIVYADTYGSNVKYIQATYLLSTDEIEPGFDVSVYPNPFNDYTTINFGQVLNGGYHSVIYDALGNEVFKKENIVGDQIQIQRNDLRTGIYIFSLVDNSTGSEVFTSRLVID